MLFTDSTSDAVGAPQRRSDVRCPPSCMARVRYRYSLTVGDSALACRAHVQERASSFVLFIIGRSPVVSVASRDAAFYCLVFTDNQSGQQSCFGGWSGGVSVAVKTEVVVVVAVVVVVVAVAAAVTAASSSKCRPN